MHVFIYFLTHNNISNKSENNPLLYSDEKKKRNKNNKIEYFVLFSASVNDTRQEIKHKNRIVKGYFKEIC